MDEPFEDRVLTAVADSLEAIPGLQQSAYMLSNPTAPTAEVLPGVIDWDETFARGKDRYQAVIRITVGSNFDIAAQRRLRTFRSPSGSTSVKEAVEAASNGHGKHRLGGLVDDIAINRVGPVRTFRRPDGTVVLGCDFEFEYEGAGSET